MSSNVSRMVTGSTWDTREGGSVTVLEFIDNRNVKVKHNDVHGFVQIVQSGNLANGRIKNPYRPSVFNKGYVGVGEYYRSINLKQTKAYCAWSSMLQRCYDQKLHKSHPTYIGCSVCEEWLNFQIFAHWYYNTGYSNLKYQVDKDLLVPGNKIYSPKTCCMLPAIINTSLKIENNPKSKYPAGISKNGNQYTVGVRRGNDSRYAVGYHTVGEAVNAYRQVKQERILELAEEWEKSISREAYLALLNWTVD